MTVQHCTDTTGSLHCSSDVQVSCGSLYPGHHQECPVSDAKGGWLQCLDLTEENHGSFGCPEDSYGIHRDYVWVQDGCQGNFYTCYIQDTPQANVAHITMECKNRENLYKQCQIDGAYLVNSVKFKYQFNKELSCSEGINYGIVADSIFVKDGCNGIFDVEYFPDSAAPQTLSHRTTTSSTIRQPSFTSKTTYSTTTKSSSTFSTTTGSSTTNQTTIMSPTHSQPNGGLVALTAAAVLGIFLVLFVAILAIMWLSRRYRCTKRFLERKPDTAETTEGPSVGKLLPLKFNKGNIYEEISTHDEVPTAPPVYERQPFIPHDLTGHECSLEQNNNPKNPLGENYFILDPKYKDCHSLPLNPSRNVHHTNFEREMFHSFAPDHRPCQINHPVSRMGSYSSHGNYGHEPVIRMGTFNPKIHQYPLSIGPCLEQNRQNTLPLLNGKSMRISDSDVDEDGYQKIGTFGPQQKHFHSYSHQNKSGPSASANFQDIPNIGTACNSLSPNFANFEQPSSEHCHARQNDVIFNTSSC